MRWIRTVGGAVAAFGMVFTFGLARPAVAIYLDEEQRISLRARIYSQASIRLENSQVDTVPETKAGQLVQHRNFFNPELDANLTSYLSWMKGGAFSWLAPDDLKFRVAAWGFYDGIYDYGSSQFNKSQRLVNSTIGQDGNVVEPDFRTRPRRAWFLEGPSFDPSKTTVAEVFPAVEVQNPRDIYGNQQRVNELYLSYSNGPVFIRVGRQAISWGESDTIALLDQNNPFDVTQAAPGAFLDLDEARIPLWTLRGSFNLFDRLGPFSSGFIEAYWVPGNLDVNTGILPILTASPYSVRGQDPQTIVEQASGGLLDAQFVLFDKTPKTRFGNSRWGVRVQTVINRNYTVSAWYYTHFPNAPVPVSRGLVRLQPGQPQLFVTETFHGLTPVIGVSNTFFFEPLDGIVRMEAEYFRHEPGFIPEQNLGVTKDLSSDLDVLTVCTPNRNTGSSKCGVPRADVLRWELGFDRFFFFRPLNPTNSFTLVSAFVGAWNLSETGNKDFRFNGQRKPGAGGTSPDDFVQLKKVEAFGQFALQSDYLHGRLTPMITVIGNVRGTYAILPSITYRWTDWLLFGVKLIHIGGEYQQIGFYRDRDQISLRVTYQVN